MLTLGGLRRDFPGDGVIVALVLTCLPDSGWLRFREDEV